jgi:hypothetical protein
VAEAAKQKKLSEEIQLDAVEMLRRSERALGLAIREGQDSGVIASKGEGRSGQGTFTRTVNGKDQIVTALPPSRRDDNVMQPTDYATRSELKERVYPLADIAESEFEAALASGREEANLSGRNVVAKVKELSSYRDEQVEKWTTIAELAAQGLTSAQIAKSVDMTEDLGEYQALLSRKSIVTSVLSSAVIGGAAATTRMT